MKRLFKILIPLLIILILAVPVSAQIRSTRSADGSTIVWYDSDGNALLTIDESDGVSASSISSSVQGMADDTKFNFGAGNDFSMEYDEDGTDELRITGADIIIAGNSGAQTVYFRDSGIHIGSTSDGVLAITADTTLALTGAVTLGEDDTGYDVTFYGATSGSYWKWDESEDEVVQVGDTTLTGALDITGNIAIVGTFDVGVDDTGHDVTFYTATSGSSILIDESDDRMEFDGTDVNLEDADILQFGDAQDVYMRWDATDFDILAAADDSVFKIGNGTNSFDVWIYGETAAANVILDASANTINLDGIDFQLEDADELQFGDLAAGDITMNFDGTNFEIEGGGASTSFLIGAAGNVLNVTLTGTLTVGVDDTGYDVKLFGATASSYLQWDESDNRLELDGSDANLQDSDILQFGDSQDVTMTFDGSDFVVAAAAASEAMTVGAAGNVINTTFTGTVTVGVDDTGYDVQFFTATSGSSVLVDESEDDLLITAIDTTMTGTLTVGVDDTGHDVKLFGATSGAYLLWDESGDELICAAGASIDLTTEKVMIDFKAGDASTATIGTDGEEGWVNINVDGTKVYIPYWTVDGA